MIQDTAQRNEAQFISSLRKLIFEDGTYKFLIVSAKELKEIYVQFFSPGKHDPALECEAVSNEFLPEKLRLNENKISLLKELGFKEPKDSSNFSMEFDVSSETAIRNVARVALRIFREIYDCPSQLELQFELSIE